MQLSRWKTGEGVERRNEKRVDVQEPASLRILRDASESIECQVVNRSKGGMGLRLATPLEPGSMIQIRLKDRIVMAEVRHCRRAGEEYSVGIKVEDEMTFGKEPKA